MTDENTTVRARPRGGLLRYGVAATLARTSDGGAVVAIVLLVTTSGDPGWLAGALGACITAPHLLGPFVARSLDTARDGRRVIALASVVHGATLAAAALLYPVTHAILPAALLITSGLLGPLLTGGISSRLPAIAGPSRTSQRRAQGWDVATYGIGGTVGPSIVAAVSAWASPLTATLVLATGTLIAAAFVMRLPYSPPAANPRDVPRPARTLVVMLSTGPLRRTLYLTMIVAFSVAALPITAVASTDLLGTDHAAAGVLTAAYGLGNLAGSIGVMARPLEGNADRLMTRLATLVATTLVAVVLAPSFSLATAAYAAAGIANGYFFAATLAARNEYAPGEMRGQIFVWTGALKITTGSAGTALAGTIIDTAVHLPLILAIALTTAAALTSASERRYIHTRSRPAPSGGHAQPKLSTPAEF